MEAPTTFPPDQKENFVTVVSVGSETTRSSAQCDSFSLDSNNSGYVTVLTIGDSDEECVTKDIIEEVLVYRLPGERLGFGLKFEGGTKANEFVKRLFIQSCAPDSPASRVQSSWGKLTEGDEVLEIDCMPVNTMTRIDCVRCLKDSNVVIKLLVKHFSTESKDNNKSVEDLPQVISAEKKRTPPPPPPVPPRKIPKKFYKNNVQHENPVPAARQINSEVNGNKNKKFQSPRSSGRASHSPDIPRRDRRFSDGSLGPPDAEVYVDLFSQESTQSLSESDDTGSSISTVVDRFGSFPTTTTSSLAGSLPSTPTSVQKQIDFTNLLNAYDDEDFVVPLNRNIIKQNVVKNGDLSEKVEEKTTSVNEDGSPLQPPSCFQDAPLSYGNEDMRIIETKSNEINMCEDKKTMNNKYVEHNVNGEKNPTKISNGEDKVLKKPPVPPRSRDLINAHKMNGCKDFPNIHDENMNISNLPRLVDFVPKSTTRDNFDNPVEIINVFLENERRDTDYLKNELYGDDDIDANLDVYNTDIDVYSSKWSLSSQLATIGEVEEEGSQDSSLNRSPISSTPIVIVENADNDTSNNETAKPDVEPADNVPRDDEGINGKMETLPSDSRQPPDGHEFPDYTEVIISEPSDEKYLRENYQDLYSQQLDVNEKSTKPTLVKTHKSTDSVNWSSNRSSFNDFSVQNKPLSKASSVSNSDLSSINPFDGGDEVTLRRASLEPTLHTRSQSLIDMSNLSKQKSDRWSLLAEQRRKGYSKLKGLVIPEHVSENDTTPAVNIPEIISHTTSSFVLETKIHANETTQCHSNESEPVALPLTSPPWASNTSTFPKYSPAFKRKSLQVYSQTKNNKPEELPTAISKSPVKTVVPEKSATLKNKSDELRLDNLSDSPKSLESITSPTRSDCSFDYVTNSLGKGKYSNKQESNRTPKETFNYVSKLHKDIGKSEDESDNDSAVSSSQSSYISRCSPPPSPTRSCEMLDYEANIRTKSDSIQDVDKYSNMQCRLLKAASVEAINRKNILASAKCRSGRDLKVGSPIIQRKYEDDTNSTTTNPAEIENTVKEPSIPKQESRPFELRNLIKEKRSMSEESAPKPVVNGDSGITKNAKTESVLTNKVSERNNLVTLKPVTNSLTSFSTQLRETKIPPKSNLVKPSSLRNNNKAMSVTDLRKSFEKFGAAPPPLPQSFPTSVTTKEPKTAVTKTEPKLTKQESLPEKKSVSNGEVVKLETVKPQPIPIPKEATQEKQEEISVAATRRTIVLCPEFVGGSIGITLAGGTDYETKEITVHKIRYGSVAYNDGQLKKGDKIVSINGKSTTNLTHAESVELLKEPVAEFTLIVEEGKEETVPSPQRKSFSSDTSEPKSPTIAAVSTKSATHVITLTKNGAGLGFSIEGGKDSPLGDLPLRIKKIFQAGLAEKCGELCVGDELLAINEISLTNLSRIEAWSLMKKLPDGEVSIHIYR
ncbi:hypothetical protein Zmor_002774 [Zophobas morio]|uniref:PDZ domain-containing protein n=1 Tax=Zophobas morio TaxID=2755281 RepID=A0AA38M0P9_9CUCU|nr:hypothetical protein Zmor_002774 [Zophobas morio]